MAFNLRQIRDRLPGGERASGVSLRWKVIPAILGLALIPLIGLGFFLNTTSRNALENEAVQGLNDQAGAINAALNETINNHANDAALLAASDFLYFQSASFQDRRSFLVDHADVWGYPSDIMIIGNQGEVIVGLNPDVSYSSQADRLYFQQAQQLDPGRVFVGDIAPDQATGKMSISFATPAFSETGAPLGVVQISWPLADVNAFMSGLGRGSDLAVSLVNGSGSYIASSDTARIGTVLPDEIAFSNAMTGGDLETTSSDRLLAISPVVESDAIAGLGWAVLVDAQTSNVLAPANTNQNRTIITIIVVALLVIGASLLFAQFLIGPIQRLAVVAREIAQGNYGARVPVTSRDEVGTTARAFNQMLDEVTGLVQTREERDRIQYQIIQLLSEVNAVAEGDLTVEAEVTADELGSVADSFNFMIGELRRIISDVNSTTSAVSSASVEIARSSSSLAQSSELQSTQISDAAMAIEEMAVSVQRVSENATVSSQVAREAQLNARNGSNAVNATIEGMNRIRQQVEDAQRIIGRLGESSQEIGTFVQLISQIARQTNTLALNASIQAARAGEHGRGFAVVAEEVRRLAERSSTAAKQVSSLVTSIQTETAEAINAMGISAREVIDGAALADDAGSALSQIDAVVTRLNELIDVISQTAEQQAQTSGEISRAMREIDDVTQTTTTGTRQAAESVSSLSQLAERLGESVAAFRLSSDAPATPVGSVADGD